MELLGLLLAGAVYGWASRYFMIRIDRRRRRRRKMRRGVLRLRGTIS